jgi:hypothetical protein
MNTRDNQRGGIVLFAVIGVLLASLLAGALYFGKQQSEVAKNNTPTPIAIDTEKEATESANGATNASKPEAAENKPATPAKPSPSTQTPASPATPKPAAPRVATVPNSGPSEPLPSTGPAETALGILIVMAISFIVLAFIQSSRRLRRSALSR